MDSIGFFCKLGSYFFRQMACIYLINNPGLVRTFNFDLTLLLNPPTLSKQL